MSKYLIAMLFVMCNLSSGFAMEISEEQFRQEEELLLLGEEFVTIAARLNKKKVKHPPPYTLLPPRIPSMVM